MNPGMFQAMAQMRDGRSLRVRALKPSDREQYVEELRRLSPASFRTRFFTAKRELSADTITYLTELDFIRHVALVAELCELTGPQPAGVARFVRTTEYGHAEVAITVVDHLQGQGVGTVLMQHLVPLARTLGIRFFEAHLLTENKAMFNILKSSGYPLRSRIDSGITIARLALAESGSLPASSDIETPGGITSG